MCRVSQLYLYNFNPSNEIKYTNVCSLYNEQQTPKFYVFLGQLHVNTFG